MWKAWAMLVALGAAAPALAQPYPVKPIRAILVEGAPGAITDIVMRSASTELTARLGQPLLIDNRAGGRGNPGMEACAKSPPDGYTICLVSTSTMSFNPFTMRNMAYDPDRDFRPVVHLYFVTEALLLTPSLPVHSASELRALAVSKPGTLNFGTPGAGSNPDIYRQWLAGRWKTDIVGVSYKGFAPIVTALVTGEVHISKMGIGNAVPLLKSGKLKALAVTSSKRVALLPEVPTFEEAGLEDFPVKGWWGVLVPAGTPDAVVARVNQEFVRLFREPKFAEFLEQQYLEPAVGTPEAFGAFLKKDRQAIGQLIKQYNIPAQ